MSPAPPPATAPLDAETMEAIQVFTDAVRRERVPGVVEFRQLERALEMAIVQGTSEHLNEAASVFHALDRDLRSRIVNRARAMAQAVVDRRHGGAAPPPDGGVPLTPGQRPPLAQNASPFLAALNQSRPGKQTGGK